MSFTSDDLASVQAAIIALAKGEQVVSVTVAGRTTQYSVQSLDALTKLRNTIKQEIASASDDTPGYFVTSSSKGL